MALASSALLRSTPPGDVITLQVTNEASNGIQDMLAEHLSGGGTVQTSEPQSLLSPQYQSHIDRETTDASWPEMAALLRRETNVSSNYLMAMFFAGVVAASGLWTDTLHIVVGAMVIAPGFEPIIRVPFGLLARQDRAWKQGLTSIAAGYGAMVFGAAAASALLMLVGPSNPDLFQQYWIGYWLSATPASVLIALAAGGAGAAIIAAQRSVLSAGVMIALALVPSAAIIGMAAVAAEPGLALQEAGRWGLDALCVVVAGGLVFYSKGSPRR